MKMRQIHLLPTQGARTSKLPKRIQVEVLYLMSELLMSELLVFLCNEEQTQCSTNLNDEEIEDE